MSKIHTLRLWKEIPRSATLIALIGSNHRLYIETDNATAPKSEAKAWLAAV